MIQIHLSRARIVQCALLCVATAGVGGGCNMFRSGDEAADAVTSPPATTQQTFSSAQPLPQALQPVNRPVVQGQLPLIYLTESEGTVRVTNVDSGEEIIAFPVTASQIVRVESRGVMLANKPVIGAALAPGTYAIVIAHDDSGLVRATQTVTHAVPAAATKPSAKPAVKPAPANPLQPATPPTPTPPTQ